MEAYGGSTYGFWFYRFCINDQLTFLPNIYYLKNNKETLQFISLQKFGVIGL